MVRRYRQKVEFQTLGDAEEGHQLGFGRREDALRAAGLAPVQPLVSKTDAGVVQRLPPSLEKLTSPSQHSRSSSGITELEDK